MDAADNCTSPCLWRPDPKRVTNADVFREKVNKAMGLNLRDYNDLYDWSIVNYQDFWGKIWEFTSVKYSQIYEQVVDTSKRVDEIPEWFRGSQLNFAENLLKCKDNRVAIYAAMEGREEVKKRTFSELHERVAQYAAALRAMGVKKGDRVVGYLPNAIEAVEAMLATSSIGAIWSSTSPDFGVTGVLDRFSQIKPKVIFSVNAVVYNGKVHDHLEKLQGVVNGLPDIQKVVIIPYVPKAGEVMSQTKIQNVCLLDEFLKSGQTQKGTYPPLKFEQLPFNHPLFIMYSSGTTGVPKCIVHSAGGTLIKHLEEHVMQGNMRKDDIMLYYTTTGWMMWNWFVSALSVGASIVCYDGSPLIPTPDVLWDLIDNIGITVLGTGAKWLAVLEEKGVKPKESHSLNTLKSILSTGSPLKPESFDYVYRDIKSDVVLGSITGGTDIIGCFAGNGWNVPVYRGEIQCRFLGMAVQSWDENGKPIEGDSGELVCTKPFPSMPTHFWNDEDGSKYHKAYFDKFEGVWAHGDFCMISPHTGGITMLGRSDGTLNPNGVRFGSSEIYNVVESFKQVQDSLCIAQRSHDGSEERVILFLKMAPGCAFSDELVKDVRAHVRLQLSARHVPTIVLPTNDIPYTHSGKKVEVAVKRVLAGDDVKIRGAYANPDSLDLYRNIPQLQGY